MLLTVVAVASGVTISCGSGGIGLYNPGWDAAFEDAAKKEAGNPFPDASADAPDDSPDDATDGEVEGAVDATPD
jgi:hypothetical protein